MKTNHALNGLKVALCTVLLVITFTVSSFAQYGKWEVGVGLRPLNLKDEPYNFILKNHLSSRIALRFGVGVMYNEKSSEHYFSRTYFYPDTTHHLAYEFKQVDKNFYASSFLGIQYGQKFDGTFARKHGFYFYGATDFIFKYEMGKSEIPYLSFFLIQPILKPSEYYEVGNLEQTKALSLGVRQSIGFQFFLSNSISLSVEGSIQYLSTSIRKNESYSWIQHISNDQPGAIGFTILAPRTDRVYQFTMSPLTFLTLCHHF
jgi:hypothetical protein